MTEYVVYCDESSHTHFKKRPYYAIGSIWLPRDQKEQVNRDLKQIKKDCGLLGEVKWQKVSHKYIGRYSKIVDYFFANPHLHFRVILVDHPRVRYDDFHDGDLELGFYKFYYQLLWQWFEEGYEYLILLDYKNNRGADRFVNLRDVLGNKAKSLGARIKDLTVIRSTESHILQVCDLFTGAVATSYNNDFREASAKRELEGYVADKLEWSSLRAATNKDFRKFNIFKIDLGRNAP